MLFHLTLIFACQLAGELVVAATGAPLPGPVAGMALLFAGLWLRGGVPADMQALADGLLARLSLLFVPAGTGVMVHLGLMAGDALPIGASLIVSTAVAILVTGWTMQVLGRREDGQ